MPSPALCYRRCCEESLAWGHRLLVSLKREGLLVYESAYTPSLPLLRRGGGAPRGRAMQSVKA
jgi:hypothetical protein